VPEDSEHPLANNLRTRLELAITESVILRHTPPLSSSGKRGEGAQLKTSMELKVGQVVQFIRPVQADGKRIKKGARARIAHVMAELVEPKLTLILLDGETPEPILLERHVVALNSIPVTDNGAKEIP
jgi:hypothetical protein